MQIQQLIDAIQTTPNDPGLHYELGGLYLANHDTEAALLAYQQALLSPPITRKSCCNWAIPRVLRNALRKPQSILSNASTCNSNNAAAHYNLGNAYIALGDSNQAVMHFKQALKYEPKDADAYNNMGNAFRDLGRLMRLLNATNKRWPFSLICTMR